MEGELLERLPTPKYRVATPALMQQRLAIAHLPFRLF
jgi:hypothetical protein